MSLSRKARLATALTLVTFTTGCMKSQDAAWPDPWYGVGLHLASWTENRNCGREDYLELRQIADGRDGFEREVITFNNTEKGEILAEQKDLAKANGARFARVLSVYCESGMDVVIAYCDVLASPEYGESRASAVRLEDIDYLWAEPFCALPLQGRNFPLAADRELNIATKPPSQVAQTLQPTGSDSLNKLAIRFGMVTQWADDPILNAEYGRALLRRFTVNEPGPKRYISGFLFGGYYWSPESEVFNALGKAAQLDHLSGKADYCSWSLLVATKNDQTDYWNESLRNGFNYCVAAWDEGKVPGAAFNAATFIQTGRGGTRLESLERWRLGVRMADAATGGGLVFDSNTIDGWRQSISNAELRASYASSSSPPSSQTASTSSGNNTAVWIALGLGAMVLLGTMAGGDKKGRPATTYNRASDGNWEPESRDKGYDDYAAQQRNAYKPPEYAEPKPDNSVGCAWGDRDYGTCH